MATVSVLIPTYNREEFIEGAIRTVLNQTYEDIEAVIVNDQSTDRTPEILQQYSDIDRIRIFHNETNRGIAASHNRAAREANGEYLCILDDDDRWHPTKVEKQVRLMETLGDEFAVVYTGGVDTKNDQIIRWYDPSLHGNIYPEILRKFSLNPHSSHMIRSTHFESIGGFDTSFPRGVDWELSIRLAQKYEYEYIREPLVKRKIHGQNVSEKQQQVDVGALIWQKYGEKIRQYSDIERAFRSNWYERKAWRALECGCRKDTMKYLTNAFKYDPTVYRAIALIIGCSGKNAYELARKSRWMISRAKYNIYYII